MRSEARAAAKREREELRRIRARGARLEARRQLRQLGRAFGPLGTVLHGWMARIAPYVSRGLLLMVSVPAALIALVLSFTQSVIRWFGAWTLPIAEVVARFLSIHVRPAGTVAFVAAAAAIALGVSQFSDYSGVEVSASLYAGEVGTTAPVPLTALERAGDAHMWVLLPVAAAALVLILQTYRGNWRLGRIVGALGLLAVLVTLAIDLPQGLDGGRAGVSFNDTRAVVIEGFWAQLSAAVALVFCGPLLGAYVRRALPAGRAGERPWSRGRPFRRRSRRKVRPVVAAGGDHQPYGGAARGGARS